MIYNKGYDVYIDVNYSGGINVIYKGQILPQYLTSARKGIQHPYPLVYVPEHGEVPVHRLVNYCFNGWHDPKLVVDHIDNNPFNNHPFNLRVVTKSDNLNNRKYQQERTPYNMKQWFNHWVDTNYTIYNKEDSH